MKRDLELIRHLLLEIESKDDGSGNPVDMLVEDRNRVETIEHLFLLKEAGLIEGVDASHSDGRDFIVLRMTWPGHDFLDSVRDEVVWGKTKKAIDSLGGWTLNLVKELGIAVAKQGLRNYTGIDL